MWVYSAHPQGTGFWKQQKPVWFIRESTLEQMGISPLLATGMAMAEQILAYSERQSDSSFLIQHRLAGLRLD
jgi:hypothetical protein